MSTIAVTAPAARRSRTTPVAAGRGGLWLSNPALFALLPLGPAK